MPAPSRSSGGPEAGAAAASIAARASAEACPVTAAVAPPAAAPLLSRKEAGGEYAPLDIFSSADDISMAHFRRTTAALLENVGFTSAQDTSVNILTDVMRRFMHKLCINTKRNAENADRTNVNLEDLALSFDKMHFSSVEMYTYLKDVRPVKPPKPTPRYPVATVQRPLFGQPVSKRELAMRPAYIPEHLPPVYTDWKDSDVLEAEQEPGPSTAAAEAPSLPARNDLQKAAAKYHARYPLIRRDTDIPLFTGVVANALRMQRKVARPDPFGGPPKPFSVVSSSKQALSTKQESEQLERKHLEADPGDQPSTSGTTSSSSLLTATPPSAAAPTPSKTPTKPNGKYNGKNKNKSKNKHRNEPWSVYSAPQSLEKQCPVPVPNDEPSPSVSNSCPPPLPSISASLPPPTKAPMFKRKVPKSKAIVVEEKPPSRQATPLPLLATPIPPPIQVPEPVAEDSNSRLSRISEPQSSRNSPMPKLEKSCVDDPPLEEELMIPHTPGSATSGISTDDLFLHDEQLFKSAAVPPPIDRPKTPAALTPLPAFSGNNENASKKKNSEKAEIGRREQERREAEKKERLRIKEEERLAKEQERLQKIQEKKDEKAKKEAERRQKAAKILNSTAKKKQEKQRQKELARLQMALKPMPRPVAPIVKDASRPVTPAKPPTEVKVTSSPVPPPSISRVPTPAPTVPTQPAPSLPPTLPPALPPAAPSPEPVHVPNPAEDKDDSSGTIPYTLETPTSLGPTEFPTNLSMSDPNPWENGMPILHTTTTTLPDDERTESRASSKMKKKNKKKDRDRERSHDGFDSEKRMEKERRKQKKKERREKEEREKETIKKKDDLDNSEGRLKLTIRFGQSKVTERTTTSAATPSASSAATISTSAENNRTNSPLRLKLKPPEPPSSMEKQRPDSRQETVVGALRVAPLTMPVTKAELKAPHQPPPLVLKDPFKISDSKKSSKASSSDLSLAHHEKKEKRLKEKKRHDEKSKEKHREQKREKERLRELEIEKEKERVKALEDERERARLEEKERDRKEVEEKERDRKEVEEKERREREEREEREREELVRQAQLQREKEIQLEKEVREREERERKERERNEKEQQKKKDKEAERARLKEKEKPKEKEKSLKRPHPDAFSAALVSADERRTAKEKKEKKKEKASNSRESIQNSKQEEKGSDEQIWNCPVCAIRWSSEGPEMIGCDSCENWYHWHCVGIVVEPPQEEPWFCTSSRCRKAEAVHKKNKGRQIGKPPTKKAKF